MDALLQQARTFFLEGVAHYQAARWTEAERQFAAALSLVPGRPSVLTNSCCGRRLVGPAGRDAMAAAGHPATELSMGMSGDYEVAVEEGATMIRLGTILFGVRA